MKKLVFLTLFGSLFIGTNSFAKDAESILESNGCLGCHAIASRKDAPAFAGIAKRNLRFSGSNAKSIIINSIKNGSNGKYPRFSDNTMPAFANLSDSELDIIADFILKQSSKAKGGHKGGGMGMHGGSGRMF